MNVLSFLFTFMLPLLAFASPLAIEPRDSLSSTSKNLLLTFIIEFLESSITSTGLAPICPGLKTMDSGCIRYTSGFDVTGVVTEVDLTFPEIQSACDCIQACLNRSTTCSSYVYKFSTPASVQSGHRTCTLYSQFNLPSDVTVDYNLTSNLNVNINAPEIIKMGNNPQAGSTVPQAFMDANLNTTADPDAVSGPIWHLSNGQAQC